MKNFALLILLSFLTACQAYDVKKAEAAFTGFDGNPTDFPVNPDNPDDDGDLPPDDDGSVPPDDNDLPPDDDGGESSSSVASNENPPQDDDAENEDPLPPPPADDDLADDDAEDDDGGESSSSIASTPDVGDDDGDLPPVVTPPGDEGNLQCHGKKNSEVEESDFEDLALTLPDSCLAGFELNSPLPQKGLEFKSLDLLGAQARVLEFQYASYSPPSSVRITGRLLGGESYTLFESCGVRTDIAPSGKKKDRPDEEHIRHYRLNLRSGTISIKFEAVKQTPFYVRLLGLCDFDMIALRATPTERLNYVNSRN